jgi:hypothetical protein
MKFSSSWLEDLFSKDPQDAWADIFEYIRQCIPESSSDLTNIYQPLETEVGYLDHVLATSAWDLWNSFSLAPRGSAFVRKFWQSTIGPKAILILDSLSIREIAPILYEANQLGLKTKTIACAGSEIPSETEFYAKALGLSGRFSLKNKASVPSFINDKNETYVDTYKRIPFSESADRLPNERNIFLWHGWPDDTLHDLESAENAMIRFIENVQETIHTDGFRNLLKKLSMGRTLLITSDHGYCNTTSFIPSSSDHHKELKTLGHSRSKIISDLAEITYQTVPPATLEMKSTSTNDIYRLALGRRRPRDKGYPALAHGGLSLMECTVPLIELIGGTND